MLRYLTAGESHGEGLIAVLEGIPAGLKLDIAKINRELKRRQQGFGRGKRMQIESDTAQVLSGIRKGATIGSPIGLFVKNKDTSIDRLPDVFCPRPGHADLAGLLKYGFKDARSALERASARETAMRVAMGAVCKMLLEEFKIKFSSKTISVGGETNSQGIREKILKAVASKDTVGGVFEVRAEGVPLGLGSYIQADKRLDARLASAIISIPGVKAIEFGLGFEYALQFGSECHDAIYYNKARGYFRKTNNAGGIEGGISNGEDVVLRACMKPISTLLKPLETVNLKTKKPAKATVERSDICVVQSAGIIAEAACALVVADAFLEKFGSDSLPDIKQAYQNYLKRIR